MTVFLLVWCFGWLLTLSLGWLSAGPVVRKAYRERDEDEGFGQLFGWACAGVGAVVIVLVSWPLWLLAAAASWSLPRGKEDR